MESSIGDWRLRNAYKLSEAALLIKGINPDSWPNEKLLSTPPPGFKAVYGRMLMDAATVTHENIESQEYPGEYYTEYALMTDKPSTLTKLTDRDGLVIEVYKHDLEYWLKNNKDIPDRFFLSEGEAPLVSPDKPLAERERKSLHRIIGAMLDTLLRESAKNSDATFKTQEQLIGHLVQQYGDYEGLSKSKLEEAFALGNKLLTFQD